MSRIKLAALLTVIIAMTHPTSLKAQSALAKATSVRCTFSLMSISNLREEPPKAELKPSTMPLQFEEINADEGTAQLKGGVGAYDIVVRYAGGYLNFIQSFRDGPVYLTTVLDQKTRGGKLKAMHSRHEFTLVSLPGFTSSAEQYYGECEILK
jgi:hypothetical protein